MKACRHARTSDSSSEGSDVESGPNCQRTRRHILGKDEKTVLQCCSFFVLLTAAVLLTLDTRRITWVTDHFAHKSPVLKKPSELSAVRLFPELLLDGSSLKKLRAPPLEQTDSCLQDFLEDMLEKGLDFLATDSDQNWDRDAVEEKMGMRIPRILHHVFLDGEDEYSRHVHSFNLTLQRKASRLRLAPVCSPVSLVTGRWSETFSCRTQDD